MKKITFFLFITFSMFVSAQTITNVETYQSGNTIIVSYDLDEEASYIHLEISIDGGRNYTKLKKVSGDVGDNISPGRRHIIWNVLEEYEKFIESDVLFRVIQLKLNGHGYEDLGLSVMWARYNVGATTISDCGGLYAWGETSTKSTYKWDNYRYRRNNYGDYSKYNRNDGLTTLEDGDDVAHMQWGSPWRMPTQEEWIELEKKCNWELSNINGTPGYIVTGPNGNSIFLPTTPAWRGGPNGKGGITDSGLYRSSSRSVEDPSITSGYYFHGSSRWIGEFDRWNGCSIRAVWR